MKTLQRVLAIVGGAFLIGTVQAVVFGPVTLGPANITTGVDKPKGDPGRAPADPPPAIDGNDTNEDVDPGAAHDAMMDDLQNAVPTTTYSGTGATDPLLDAPVPEGSLTLREAKKLWDEGVYFIDARHEHEFEAGHIQYAAFLESKLFDMDIARANAVMDSIPQDGTIVLYCVGGECDASKNTAALLEQYGYTDLRIMGAGYEHWVAAGFETATGSDGGTP